jgi:hypothetical protein
MTRVALVLVFAACLVLAASPATAQDALSKRVTLDLKGMAPSQAFRMIADLAGMGITISTAVTTPVDILVRDVTAKTALTVICESIGCTWRLSSGVIVVAPADGSTPTGPIDPGAVSPVLLQNIGTVEQRKLLLERIQAALKQPLPAGMKFENAPLSTVSGRLSDALGLTVTLMSEDPALRTVTADFSSKTLMTALQELGSSGSNPPPLRLTVSYPSTPGGPVTPSIMIGFKMDPKKK